MSSKKVDSINLNEYYATALEFTQNLNFLILGLFNGTIKIHDPNSFFEIYSFTGFNEIKRIIAYNE